MKIKMRKLAVVATVCVMLLSVLMVTACNDETQDDPIDVTETSETQDEDTDTTDATEPTTQSVNLEHVYDPALVERLNRTFTIDGNAITAAEYNFFYVNTYTEFSTYAYSGYYPATYEGFIDLRAECQYLDDGGTWGDFLDKQVEREIQKAYIMHDLAKDAGLTVSEANEESMNATLQMIKDEAQNNDVEADAYLAQHYGEDMSIDLFTNIMNRNFLANAYYDYYVGNYEFAEDEGSLPTVRHILFPVERDAPEEDIDEAFDLAEGVLNEVSEYEDMIILGDRETTAERSAESAEYTVQMGQMVQEFEDWCFDPERQEGDKDIVQTRFGFHVMYFVGTTEPSESQKIQIAENTLSAILDEQATSERFTLVPA